MVKNDFVRAIAEASNGTLNQRQVNAALDAINAVVLDVVKAQDSVKIGNFVTVKGEMKAACTRRNPRTGETVDCPEKLAPKAKFSASFKAALND